MGKPVKKNLLLFAESPIMGRNMQAAFMDSFANDPNVHTFGMKLNEGFLDISTKIFNEIKYIQGNVAYKNKPLHLSKVPQSQWNEMVKEGLDSNNLHDAVGHAVVGQLNSRITGGSIMDYKTPNNNFIHVYESSLKYNMPSATPEKAAVNLFNIRSLSITSDTWLKQFKSDLRTKVEEISEDRHIIVSKVAIDDHFKTYAFRNEIPKTEHRFSNFLKNELVQVYKDSSKRINRMITNKRNALRDPFRPVRDAREEDIINEVIRNVYDDMLINHNGESLDLLQKTQDLNIELITNLYTESRDYVDRKMEYMKTNYIDHNLEWEISTKFNEDIQSMEVERDQVFPKEAELIQKNLGSKGVNVEVYNYYGKEELDEVVAKASLDYAGEKIDIGIIGHAGATQGGVNILGKSSSELPQEMKSTRKTHTTDYMASLRPLIRSTQDVENLYMLSCRSGGEGGEQCRRLAQDIEFEELHAAKLDKNAYRRTPGANVFGGQWSWGTHDLIDQYELSDPDFAEALFRTHQGEKVTKAGPTNIFELWNFGKRLNKLQHGYIDKNKKEMESTQRAAIQAFRHFRERGPTNER